MISTDADARSGVLYAPMPAATEMLRRLELTASHTLLYKEAVISDGTTIAVLGTCMREPDRDAPPADAYRGDAPTRLRVTSASSYPLVISDDPSALK